MYLLPILFPPCEDTLPILAPHQPINIFALHPFGSVPIGHTVSIVQINSMLMHKISTLLFIIYRKLIVSTFHAKQHNGEGANWGNAWKHFERVRPLILVRNAVHGYQGLK